MDNSNCCPPQGKSSGYARFIKILGTVCGIFGFVAYFSYLIKMFIWPEGVLPMSVAIAGILVAGVPVFFQRFFRKHLPRKLFSVLWNVFSWGMLFYCVTFMVLAGYIYGAGSMQASAQELPDNTVFIVYGAGINDDRPGAILRKRLNKTVEYMDALPESVCIVTGGQGPDEICPESEVMFNYLAAAGISEDRIIIESKARNTIENIKYSAQILKDKGFENRTVVSISNAFHIPRIKLICSRLGIESKFVLAPDPNPYAMFCTLVREYMSYAKLFIFGAE